MMGFKTMSAMDEYFEALANAHRRQLLVPVLNHNPQRDDINVPEDVNQGQNETLQTEFYHSYLPELEEARFVGWSRDTHGGESNKVR